jgi:hypothetical protein
MKLYENGMARNMLERFCNEFIHREEIGGLFNNRVQRIEQNLAMNS